MQPSMSVLPASLWPALHRLDSGEPWPPSEAGAERLVQRAAREGLLPLLFEDRSRLPPAVAAALDRRRALQRAQLTRTDLLREAAGRLAKTLEPGSFVFLKGCDYAWRLYARPDLRPMQDIDVLVPSSRIEAATRRLEGAGFPRSYPAGAIARTAGHYERAFNLGGIHLDLHQAFVPSFRLRVDYEVLFARSVAFDGPCPARRLADLDALAYHAVAMAKDELAVPLLRHVDLWLLLQASPFGPDLVALARDWRAQRALYAALASLRRLFPEAESLVSDRDLGSLLPSRTRLFLDRRVIPAPGTRRTDARWPRATQLWRKYWLIEGLARRAAFLLSHTAAALRGRFLSAVSPEPRR